MTRKHAVHNDIHKLSTKVDKYLGWAIEQFMLLC